MTEDTDDGDSGQHWERRRVRFLCASAELSHRGVDDGGDDEPERDDPQRPVRRPAVPAEIRAGTPERGDDVEIRRVGREHKRRGRAAAGPCQRRSRQRQRESVASRYPCARPVL